MADAQGGKTAEAVLRLAAEAGLRVTKTQLRDWRQGGFISPPQRHWLGRGRGSESLYPPGTAQQVIKLCEELAMKRSLIHAGWTVWWKGGWLSEELIRLLLNVKVAQLQLVSVENAQGKLETLIDGWGHGRLPHLALRAMRRDAKGDRFPVVLKSLVKFGLGDFDGFEGEEAEIVASGLGFSDSEDLEGQLRATSPAYAPRRFREALEASSLEEIEAARDEVCAAFQLSAGLIALMEAVRVRPMSRDFSISLKQPSLDDGLYLILLWLSVRKLPGVQKIYEEILSRARRVVEGILSPDEAWDADISLDSEKHSSEEKPNE